MASSRPRQFLFVKDTFGTEPISQREKELEDASRRSHAARNSKIRQALPLRPASKVFPNIHAQRSSYVLSEGRWQTLSSAPRPTKQRQVRQRVQAKRWHDEVHNDAIADEPTQSLIEISPRYGHYDPFDAAPVTGVPAVVFDILEYGMSH
jgi:hypothetical protein